MARGSIAGVVALVAALSTTPVRAVNHPFGSHPFTYAAGSILPSHVSAAARDQAVRDFYDVWKATYLRQACGTGRYEIATAVAPGNLTVSEGMGYGMLVMALMAGHDPDAKLYFDGMLAYASEHPTATHRHLMSWYQTTSCADAQGNDSASDGDLDIAYALLLADKQWGSGGGIDYLAAARAVVADVRAGEVDASGQYVLLGDWATPDDAKYYPATRSSDFMPDHYGAFQAATGDAGWTGLRDRTYDVVEYLQAHASPDTGLLPDFVKNPLGAPAPASPNFLEAPTDGAYGYNACRDPWRLATDFLVTGDVRARTAVQRIDTWIRAATGGDPANVKSGYRLDGTMSSGADYLSMAFVAPLGVGAMVDAANQSWLDGLWDLVVATPAADGGYYENTLKLLAMIVMSGNWWPPDSVSGGYTPPGDALCPDGARIYAADVKLGRLDGAPGQQHLTFSGKLFFPTGIPAPAPWTDGAQLLLEDLGAGSSAVFELSAATTPVPPASTGACDPKRDGWKVATRTTSYRNRSTALDPPACTPGSARGLYSLLYRPRSALDLDFTVKTRGSTIAPVVGPLRGTIVLGSTAAAGRAGACGLTASLACTGKPANLRCR